MKIPQVFTLIHENPSGFYIDPSNRQEIACWNIKENPLK